MPEIKKQHDSNIILSIHNTILSHHEQEQLITKLIDFIRAADTNVKISLALTQHVDLQ